MIKNFIDLVASGTRFTFSVDELANVRKRSYFNLWLHGRDGKVFNLGLIYIAGKCDAEETRKIVEDSLIRFQLNSENHIVATTSNGSNVMKKFGRESPSEMILCLNYAIHLWIEDIFYENKQATTTSAVATSEDTDDSDDEIMENKNSSDGEENCNCNAS